MESYFRAAQEAVLKEAALRVSDVARVSLGGLDSHRHVERDPARRDAEGPLDERGGRIALLGPSKVTTMCRCRPSRWRTPCR